MAHDEGRSGGTAPAGPGRARFQRHRAEPALGGRTTYLRSWEGVTYLAFVIDAFSRKVVGWQQVPAFNFNLIFESNIGSL